jgi:hypothetical protein
MLSLKPTTTTLIDQSSAKLRTSATRLDRDYLILKKKEDELQKKFDEMKARPPHLRNQTEVKRIIADLVKTRTRIEVNTQRNQTFAHIKDDLDNQKFREDQIAMLTHVSAAKSRMAISSGNVAKIKSMTKSSQEADVKLAEVDKCLSEAFEGSDPTATGSGYSESEQLMVDDLYHDMFIDDIPSVPTPSSSSHAPSPSPIPSSSSSSSFNYEELQARLDALMHNPSSGPPSGQVGVVVSGTSKGE